MKVSLYVFPKYYCVTRYRGLTGWKEDFVVHELEVYQIIIGEGQNQGLYQPLVYQEEE